MYRDASATVVLTQITFTFAVGSAWGLLCNKYSNARSYKFDIFREELERRAIFDIVIRQYDDSANFIM